jgi:hypothetical protein
MNHTLQGIDLEHCGVQKLTVDLLRGIDLERFPPSRVHFLVHALQMQTKVPS